MYSNLHFWRCYSPHLCVGRRLLLLLLPPSRRLPHTPLTHHITCSHTTCSHTTQLTHNLLTYNLSSHNLLTHNSTHTQLAHIQLNSHNLSSHNMLTHNLSFVTSTFVSRGRRGTWWHPPSFHVAGVALGDIHLRFTWQAWRWRHWAGSGGAPGSQLTPWMPRLFAWQAWHLVTSTFVSRAMRGTRWHRSSLCVAGVALTALGGLWWRTGFPADAMDATALCVAGTALADIHLHFAWQDVASVALTALGGLMMWTSLLSSGTLWRRIRLTGPLYWHCPVLRWDNLSVENCRWTVLSISSAICGTVQDLHSCDWCTCTGKEWNWTLRRTSHCWWWIHWRADSAKARWRLSLALTCSRLYTFNRLWLDHCLTTGSVERFVLEPTELETGMIFELQGLTLGALSALSTEMTCTELYGYHCRGLVGHLVLTVSHGKMIGLNTDDMSYQMQFGTLGTAPTGAMNTARVATVPPLMMMTTLMSPLWMWFWAHCAMDVASLSSFESASERLHRAANCKVFSGLKWYCLNSELTGPYHCLRTINCIE